MGWGSGNGKAEVLNAAAGEPVICGSDDAHPFSGKSVLIDISGLAHKASKRNAAEDQIDGPAEPAEVTPRAAASRGIKGGPFEAQFSSGLSDEAILKVVFAAADRRT